MPTFDQQDAEILNRRISLYNRRTGPRVGDFLRMQDGAMLRFTHDWGDDIQTTIKGCGDASFYLGNGYCSFSGSLDSAIPKTRIHATDEIKDGSVWFFHHDHAQAHNGVYTTMPFRVYRCTE